jgi:lipase chaperone LimK
MKKILCLALFMAACDSREGVQKVGVDTVNPPTGDNWAASLSGSVMDGALTLGAGGHYVPDVRSRQLFDWALSATGEVREDILEQRLTDYVRASLVPPAQAEALDVLGRYLNYRRAGSQLLPASDAATRLQEVIALRAQFFTPSEHQALFGAEEARAQVAVAQMVVAGSQATDSDKSAAAARIAANLPPAAKQAQDAARAPVLAFQQEAAMRAAGASADSIDAFRRQTFGDDAADRLKALDADNAAFAQTLTALQGERATLLQQGASASELQAWLAKAVQQVPQRDQRRMQALLSR